MSDSSISGSCLCGGVRFELTESPDDGLERFAEGKPYEEASPGSEI